MVSSQFGGRSTSSLKRKGTVKDSMKKLIIKKAKVKHHKASIYTDLVKEDKKIMELVFGEVCKESGR